MDPSPSQALAPHVHVLHLVSALSALEVKFADTEQRWKLLDESGALPEVSFAELFQQAGGTQDSSREVFQLTAELAAIPHGRDGKDRGDLGHLSTASTMSSYATTHFAEAAETALGLPNAVTPAQRLYAEKRIVGNHSIARSYLRLTSRCLRDAITELDRHLNAHSRRPAPANRMGTVPGPAPRGHRR
ncbi:hypothetical protein [Streptomyces antarcticus]|uniref:hypothetical protein n=1 Tax=Streptomyces antarcticus TaxID=2996458 RepID=UPI00226E9ED9|nr:MULTISPECIES: hypothetical protein [unclassified Streptomyces]MCY0942356.1 hypothetical protein [Streptomyces sp. H34-AA3]MCZ4080647.1 hypothetical protein [Streptomyces sp. H34-S5]